MGLLAPFTPNDVKKSPKSGGVPAHKRYSDFEDFSFYGFAEDFAFFLPQTTSKICCEAANRRSRKPRRRSSRRRRESPGDFVRSPHTWGSKG